MKKHRYRTVVVAKTTVKPYQSLQEVLDGLNRKGIGLDSRELKVAVTRRERIHYGRKK